jgi:hypothetical protein
MYDPDADNDGFGVGSGQEFFSLPAWVLGCKMATATTPIRAF